jgi:hypothetical protein
VLFAAQFAVIVQVPLPSVIVTVVPAIEQEPVAVMVGVMPEFVVATTVKLDWYVAVAGAPVKVTVCASRDVAVVVSVTEAAVE